MDHIIAHLDAFQGALGNSTDIESRDLACLNATINQLRRDARHALTRTARMGVGEVERQAAVQNEADGGYLPVRRVIARV